MLPAATLSIVVVSNGHPPDSLGHVGAGYLGYRQDLLPGQLILAGARVIGKRVHRAKEHVIAQVVQMPPEAQPGTGRRYVVGGAFALGL